MYIIFILGVICLFTLYHTIISIGNFTPLSSKQITFKTTLENMANILNYHNIEFFLFCGTALGCHREGMFIEHDHDIDIAIFKDREDLVEIKNTIKKYPETFRLLSSYPSNVPDSQLTELTYQDIKTGVNIDIFQIEKRNNHYYFYTYNSICNNKPNRRCEFKYKPFSLETKNFLGKEYLIPTISHLREHYGDTWHIPRKMSYTEMVKEFSSN